MILCTIVLFFLGKFISTVGVIVFMFYDRKLFIEGCTLIICNYVELDAFDDITVFCFKTRKQKQS